MRFRRIVGRWRTGRQFYHPRPEGRGQPDERRGLFDLVEQGRLVRERVEQREGRRYETGIAYPPCHGSGIRSGAIDAEVRVATRQLNGWISRLRGSHDGRVQRQREQTLTEQRYPVGKCVQTGSGRVVAQPCQPTTHGRLPARKWPMMGVLANSWFGRCWSDFRSQTASDTFGQQPTSRTKPPQACHACIF